MHCFLRFGTAFSNYPFYELFADVIKALLLIHIAIDYLVSTDFLDMM